MNDSLELEFGGNFNAAMVTTNMVFHCSPHINCTEINSTPGANIASPIAMFLTGTIGNAIAIFVLHRNSRREQMRTVFYVLVGSLAWTDLAGIILTTAPVVTVYINGHWVGGVGLCNYHAFTMISVGLITPCIVCTMAVERYLGIRHGYFYKKHVNRSRVRMVLLGQWVFVLLFTSLPLFGFGQYARQYPGTWCFFNLHPLTALDSAYAYCYAIFNLSLIFIIVGCNIVVIATLIGMRHRRRHFSSPSRDRQIHRSPRQREIEIQMVALLVGITVLFTTCWAPLMIQIVMNQINSHGDDHRQDLLAIRMASINQSFDPWVYILFRKVIFTKFWKYIRGVFVSGTRLDSTRQHQSLKATAAAHQLLLMQQQPNGHHPTSNAMLHHKTSLPSSQRGGCGDMPPTAIGCRPSSQVDSGASGHDASVGSNSYSYRSPGDSHTAPAHESSSNKSRPLTKEPTVSSCLDDDDDDEDDNVTGSRRNHNESLIKSQMALMSPGPGVVAVCHNCNQPLNANSRSPLMLPSLAASRNGGATVNAPTWRSPSNGKMAAATALSVPVASDSSQDSDARQSYRVIKSSVM